MRGRAALLTTTVTAITVSALAAAATGPEDVTQADGAAAQASSTNLVSSQEAAGLPRAVVVDGTFGEWEDVALVSTDARGDGESIDLGGLWAAGDSERMTLAFDVGCDMSLQGGNRLTLYLDADGDASTGKPVQGLGADLVWTFGRRSGRLAVDGGERKIEQYDVGLRQAPTVSSTRFEVSFLRWTPELGTVVPGPEVALVLADENGGDRLPDTGTVRFRLPDGAPPSPAPVSLTRERPDDIRVLTYNVLFDGLFKRPAAFIRVLRAIDPDIICFQEIWSHTARQAADQVSLALPGATWHGANTTEGHVVSRYPFIENEAIDEAGNYWALIDLPDDRYQTDIAIVSAHPPCCDKERERQEQLDGIAAWLRDRTTGSAPGLERGTPIVVAGDMNLVGGQNQLRTLLAGEIAYEDTYGPSHPADWDGTPLKDSDPRHAGGRDNFTWRDARSSFAPGKLDYIVYSDSVVELGNAYVLATEELDAETLERLGLRAGDTLEASDHLPVVADLRLLATPVVEPARTGRGEPRETDSPEATP